MFVVSQKVDDPLQIYLVLFRPLAISAGLVFWLLVDKEIEALINEVTSRGPSIWEVAEKIHTQVCPTPKPVLSLCYGVSLTRRDMWALTRMVCQAVAEPGVSSESMILSVLTDGEFGQPLKCPRSQTPRPWQRVVVPRSRVHSTRPGNPSPEGKGGLGQLFIPGQLDDP